VKPSAAIAMTCHDYLNCETTSSQLAATARLRKN
jgi:hypothetical protein